MSIDIDIQQSQWENLDNNLKRWQNDAQIKFNISVWFLKMPIEI